MPFEGNSLHGNTRLHVKVGHAGWRDYHAIHRCSLLDFRRSRRPASTSSPDGRLVPFDTYNLFYRGALDQTRLQPIRKEIEEELARVCLLE